MQCMKKRYLTSIVSWAQMSSFSEGEVTHLHSCWATAVLFTQNAIQVWFCENVGVFTMIFWLKFQLTFMSEMLQFLTFNILGFKWEHWPPTQNRNLNLNLNMIYGREKASWTGLNLWCSVINVISLLIVQYVQNESLKDKSTINISLIFSVFFLSLQW